MDFPQCCPKRNKVSSPVDIPVDFGPEQLHEGHELFAQLAEAVDAFLIRHSFRELDWMVFCGEPYAADFESMAKQAQTKPETGKDLFSAQDPNMADTLATCRQRSAVEKAGPRLMEQLQGNYLIEEDMAMVKKQVGKKEDVKALFEELGTVAAESGEMQDGSVRERIVGSLNAAQRAMSLGRLILEVFERKGLEKLNTLMKKLQLVALIILHHLGKNLLQTAFKAGASSWRKHVLHGLMRIAADAYSHLALALRYEAHYEMTKPRGHYSAKKALALLKDGHEMNRTSLHYRTLARSPARMSSSMNGMVQNAEFLYTLDSVVAKDQAAQTQTEFAPAFEEAEVLECRLKLWRVVGGIRWADSAGWAVIDTTRRIPNILLKKALLEAAPDEEVRQAWLTGMRLRQLVLGLLLRPKGDNGYNRYPGFLPPITLVEILHDIADAEAMVRQARPQLGLALRSSEKGGACDIRLLIDLVRQRFSVHGEVGNFLEVHTEGLLGSVITSLSSAEDRAKHHQAVARFQATLFAEPADDAPIKEVLPTTYKLFPVLSSVVLAPDEIESNTSPYLGVLRLLAHVLLHATGKPHTLWSPGEALEAALDLSGPGSALAREAAALAGYWAADGTVDYATSKIAEEYSTSTAEPGVLHDFVQTVEDSLRRVSLKVETARSVKPPKTACF